MTKPRLLPAILAAGLIAALAGLPASAQPPAPPEVLLDRCDDLTGWGVNPGREFPGADGKLSLVQDAEKGACMRLDYDFRGGGNYVTAERALNIASATAVSFSIKQAGGNGGMIRIADDTAQEHAGGFPISGNGWQRIVMPLDEKSFGWHWQGDRKSVV